ncbi:MAG: UDP-N-acetylmuramyl-tripeptide synthetase, partial [Dethiobacter sp.]|nr:UDP-N-acetylmuramyl-tripeptide synthetase [Dethiobacter sp.]
MKTLAELVKVLLHKEVRGPVEIAVNGLAYHSGQVKPGDLFFCLPGARSHGKRYMAEAEAAGAVAVVTDLPEVETSVTLVRVPEIRMALALLAAHFYDYPSRELVLTGVTGTNGKTTVTHLIDALLASSGAVTGLIGTVRYHIGGVEYPSLATTPEANELQALLRRMRSAGVTHATMEVSSHALALQRTIGCDFDTVVLTNVTEDHLDFHQTFEHYLGSKIKLFSSLGSFPLKESRSRRAVVNGDDAHWAHFADQTPAEVLLYGLSPRCHIRASAVQVLREGVSFTVDTPGGSASVRLKMTGLFSVYNALAAIAAGYLEGLPLEQIISVLEGVSGIPG